MTTPTRPRVVWAVVYAIAALGAWLTVATLFLGVLPRAKFQFDAAGVNLPALTKAMLDFGGVVNDALPLFAVAAVVAGLAVLATGLFVGTPRRVRLVVLLLALWLPAAVAVVAALSLGLAEIKMREIMNR